ncbi:hypothetical protein Leryth_011506 [Lithospermum erythrorhizon]|nr:hypothetical protein Leryth_011506 [Lithospermum erythrorhizon]
MLFLGSVACVKTLLSGFATIDGSCKSRFVLESFFTIPSKSNRLSITAESEAPLLSRSELFKASTNHVSDLASFNRAPMEVVVSGFTRKRNKRIRAGFTGAVDIILSCSSIIFSKSSSVVTEMSESSSSFGSWYFMVIVAIEECVRQSFVDIGEGGILVHHHKPYQSKIMIIRKPSMSQKPMKNKSFSCFTVTTFQRATEGFTVAAF